MRAPTAEPVAQAGDAAVIEASLSVPEAFAELFDRHAPLIHRYIARRVGAEIADDLAAETFLAAFRRRQRYDCEHADARPWLYGIATHLISQHRRDESRWLRARLSAGLVRAAEPSHDDRVAADVTASGVRDALVAALDKLPPVERDVLLLIAWEELSYAEAATALGVPVGTVRSRLSRARHRVRAALSKTELTTTFKEILANE